MNGESWLARRVRAAIASGRLVVKVLPFVAVVTVLKLLFHELDLEPLELNALLSGLVGANVFLLGFLLAGTVADYKESERLPGEVAASLETMADECLIIREAKADPAAEAFLLHLLRLTVAIRLWIMSRGRHGEVLDHIRDLNPHLLSFEPLTQPGYLTRLRGEQHALRRLVIRIHVIQQTSFVTAGYLVADVLGRLVVLALLLTDIGATVEAMFFVATITFLLTYTNRLIRDLDNPFEYPNGKPGSADVSLVALEEFQKRLESQVLGTNAPPPSAEAPAAAAKA